MLVLSMQVCRWEFLIFSGTFETTLSVSEHPDQGRLVFDLLKSAFMRSFHVCWQVRLRDMPSQVPKPGVMEAKHGFCLLSI